MCVDSGWQEAGQELMPMGDEDWGVLWQQTQRLSLKGRQLEGKVSQHCRQPVGCSKITSTLLLG